MKEKKRTTVKVKCSPNSCGCENLVEVPEDQVDGAKPWYCDECQVASLDGAYEDLCKYSLDFPEIEAKMDFDISPTARKTFRERVEKKHPHTPRLTPEQLSEELHYHVYNGIIRLDDDEKMKVFQFLCRLLLDYLPKDRLLTECEKSEEYETDSNGHAVGWPKCDIHHCDLSFS